MQRAELRLEELLELVQHGGNLPAGLPIDGLLIEFQPRRFHQEDLEVGEKQLDVGQPLLLDFAPHGVNQVGDLFFVRRIQLDRGHAIDVVEQHAVTAHLFVVGFDTEEVRMELNGQTAHGSFGNEAEGLIGNEEQERTGSKRMTPQVGPERSFSLLNPVDGEIIESPGARGIAAFLQRLDLQRTSPLRGSKSSSDAFAINQPRCPSCKVTSHVSWGKLPACQSASCVTCPRSSRSGQIGKLAACPTAGGASACAVRLSVIVEGGSDARGLSLSFSA